VPRPIFLGVNIDHVATLRQARGTPYPDPLHAALEAELGGADSITLHLREDRRHIQDRDLRLLPEMIATRINLEMAVTDEMLGIATRVRPSDCCLVPERREEVTTEGGLDVAGELTRIRAGVEQLSAAGIRVSLFIDPEPRQLEAAAEAGAPVVELHTGPYCDARDPETRDRSWEQLREATAAGERLGLQVNAGHGLHYGNVAEIAAIEGIRELNIGHAIVARALFVGLREAVRGMKTEMERGRGFGEIYGTG